MMKITRRIHNDKKEKYNSFELTIGVPTISQIDICSNNLYGYSSVDSVEYVYYFGSTEEVEEGFKRFLQILAKEYNRHTSTFIVEDIV